MAEVDTDVARLEWDAFAGTFAREWRQGEHVALVGPTGRGKTNLGLNLLPFRSWSVAIGTKPKDSTLERLAGNGYVRLEHWRRRPPDVRRVLLWPKVRRLNDTAAQAHELHAFFASVFREGGWCVFADDVQYLAHHLGLSRDLEKLWLMGRSLKLSLVAATQRPRWVPREMWTESSHHFIWGTTDRDDIRALAGLGGLVDLDAARATVARLGRHEVLYVGARSGRLAITQAPPPRQHRKAG